MLRDLKCINQKLCNLFYHEALFFNFFFYFTTSLTEILREIVFKGKNVFTNFVIIFLNVCFITDPLHSRINYFWYNCVQLQIEHENNRTIISVENVSIFPLNTNFIKFNHQIANREQCLNVQFLVACLLCVTIVRDFCRAASTRLRYSRNQRKDCFYSSSGMSIPQILRLRPQQLANSFVRISARPSIHSPTKIAEAKILLAISNFYCIVFHPLMEISLVAFIPRRRLISQLLMFHSRLKMFS